MGAPAQRRMLGRQAGWQGAPACKTAKDSFILLTQASIWAAVDLLHFVIVDAGK
jgi:hypothetical protein